MTPTDNIKNFDFSKDFQEFITPLNFHQILIILFNQFNGYTLQNTFRKIKCYQNMKIWNFHLV